MKSNNQIGMIPGNQYSHMILNALIPPTPPSSQSRILLIYLMIILLVPTATYGQNDLNNRTSEWTISQHKDKKSGEIITQGSIVILNNESISWGPSKDELMPFTIIRKRGNWNISKNKGNITYEVDMEGERGKVTFKGKPEKITITINIAGQNNSSKLQLTCTSVIYE